MLQINKIEAKTLEEALTQATIESNCSKDELLYTKEITEAKLFKGSKCIINYVEISEIKNYLNYFFKELSKNMNIEINSEILYQNESFNIILITSNNSILIGKEGKNLNALQNIIRQNLKVKTGINIKVNLDINNYKIKKLKLLEKDIKKIAKEVISSRVDASLDPMNSYERRYIHALINEYDNLSTESVGEGKERHIIIKYKENN